VAGVSLRRLPASTRKHRAGSRGRTDSTSTAGTVGQEARPTSSSQPCTTD
jgi:hypothetical protein